MCGLQHIHLLQGTHSVCGLQHTFVVDVLLSTHPAQQPQAYVEQNDNFYSMLTVAETLTMSSQLQLSPGMCADDKAKYVDNLISVLGLAKVC